MSELVLVRHGQASFGAASYDKLSDQGFEQVRLLASHWQALGEQFDHIICGSLLRQQETAQELLGLHKAPGADLHQDVSFNEYNGDPLIRIYLRDFASQEGLASAKDWPIRDRRQFQLVLEAAAHKWVHGELMPGDEDEDFEFFADFKSRVHTGIEAVMEKYTGGSKVLISTSGGVIAMALQRVLDFPDLQVIATNWMLHNSSITRIRYGGGRLSLAQFNSLPHLETKELNHMITYR